MNQPVANSSQPANLVRSEIAPLIRATVMMANIIWNAMITYVGMPGSPGIGGNAISVDRGVLVPRYWVKIPMTPGVSPIGWSVPNATVKP